VEPRRRRRRSCQREEAMRHRFKPGELERLKQAQLERVRNPKLADVIERNICTLVDLRHQYEQSRSPQDRIADVITAFSGSMHFVYLHLAWFAVWLLVNLGLLGVKPFDPYPFGLLTMIVSLEAIFLSTFVLVSQNRMQAVGEHRAALDLQINLLSEHEITRLLTLVDAIADHLGLDAGNDPEVDELKRDVAPEEVLREIEERDRQR
jgi:uncharacterized membrane protein